MEPRKSFIMTHGAGYRVQCQVCW